MSPELVNQIFGFLVRDFSESALSMVLNHKIDKSQEEIYRDMMKKCDPDEKGFAKLWESEISSLAKAY